jgi:thiopurine S-methyltransferase
MNKNFWLECWHQGQIGFDQSYPNAYMMKYFPKLELLPQSTVFVPLCGKSIDMLWLIEQGYRVIGIELSRLAGEAFFKEHQLPFTEEYEYGMTVLKGEHIRIYIGDFFELPADVIQNIDAIYDRAALIALPKELRKSYISYLKSILPRQIPALVIVLTYPQQQMSGPPFSVSESEIQQLFTHCHIEKWHDAPAKSLPVHLAEKGLCEATNQVYYINFMP